MYELRLWLGSFTFAFGVFCWTWFLRNAFKRKFDQAMGYKNYPYWIHITWNTIWIILGLYIYPKEYFIPIWPLLIGIIVGLYVSKGGKRK